MKEIEFALRDRDLFDLYTESLPEPDENGFFPDESGTSAAYWCAAMALVPDAGDHPLPAVGTVNLTGIEERQQYHPDMVSAIHQVVSENEPFYELIEQAQRAEPGPFQPKDEIESKVGNLSLLGNIRSIARWIELYCIQAQIDKDGDRFVSGINSIFELNNNLQDQPYSVSEIVRISVDALAGHAIFDVGLSRMEFDNKQIDQLIESLRKRQSHYDVTEFLGRSLSVEYHLVLNDVQAFIAYSEARQAILLRDIDPEAADFFGVPEDQSWISGLWDSLLLEACPGKYELRYTNAIRRTIHEYDQIKNLNDKPKQQHTEILRLIDKREAEDGDKDTSLFQTRSYNANLLFAARTVIRGDCRIEASVAALQVERYRINNGRWPTKLTDATEVTPLDARGDAILYRQTPEGVLIYTVGENGLDEEGYGQENFGEQSKYLAPDDFSIRLYNPDLRNAIPPPAEAIRPEDDYDW